MTQLEIEYVKKLKEINKLLRGPRYYEVWSKVLRLETELAELGRQCQFEILCNPEFFEPDVDFRRDIAEELSREELINRLCEMHKAYKEMRKEWFEKTQLNNLKP